MRTRTPDQHADARRQLDRERAAPAGLALHRDTAAVRFDDAPHEVQAEAAALDLPRDGFATAVERLEDVLAIVGVDAQPAIFDGDARRSVPPTRADAAPSGASPPYLMALLIRF